jgi:hydroxymethylpyrimidine/phosphomethylpyrimidine kinase
MEAPSMPFACTIAGSDSGGGAGIQADLKTFTALGVWGCTVLTAVTAQNTKGVAGSWALAPEAVAAQMEAVVDDFPIAAWKTGMLANTAVIRAVADLLPPGAPLVLDPVMVSTSGHALIEEEAVGDLVEVLVPRATVITPNLREAEILSGIAPLTDTDGMIAAAEEIASLGAGSVVVKGGHLAGRAVDVFWEDGDTLFLVGERIPHDVHGSGCSFASAIAAYLARGLDLRSAVREAKEFIGAALHGAVVSSSGRMMVHPGAWQHRPGSSR